MRYRRQRITVVGVPRAGLLAITGYGTHHPHAIGPITVLKRDGRPAYRIARPRRNSPISTAP